MGLGDRIFAELHVVATTLGNAAAGGAGSILLNVVAYAAALLDPTGETSAGEPAWGIPGFFARPRDADPTGHAEYMGARYGEDLLPLAGRDLRITRARGPAAKGSVGFGGYGGGFAAFEDTPPGGGGGNVFVLYLPYAFTGLPPGPGAPPSATKAHTITVNTTTGQESITILHGRGQYVALLPDGSVSIVSPDGTKFIRVGDDGVDFSGPVKAATGAVIGDAPSAKPVMVDPSSGAWAAEIAAKVNALITLVSSTGLPVAAGVAKAASPISPVSSATPVVSTKASASP